MRTVIVIPARGGSKRLPWKNLLAVRGVSLVARAVVAAREFATSTLHGRANIIVDTDSHEIAEEGRRWGAAVPFLRPPELAGDATSTIENVVFLLERLADQLPPTDAVAFNCVPLRGVPYVISPGLLQVIAGVAFRMTSVPIAFGAS